MYSSKSSLPSELYYFGKGGLLIFCSFQKLEFLICKTHSGHKLILIYRIPRLPALIRPFQY